MPTIRLLLFITGSLRSPSVSIIVVLPAAVDAWRHNVSRGCSMHIKAIPRQTFAHDVTVGDHADQPVILANRDSADVLCAHQFSEFGDRGIQADPLDALVHCFFDFHADLLAGVGCTTKIIATLWARFCATTQRQSNVT